MFDQMRRSMLGSWNWDGQSGTDHWEALPGGANMSVERRDDGIVVYADVPGFEREELDLTFADGVLTLSGSHETSDDHSTRHRTVHEQVSVPGDVDVEGVSATYRNGVLEVHLPTTEPAPEDHRIDID